MKAKYIFAPIAAALMLASCANEVEISKLDGISLSSTYVSVPTDGSTVTITLTASEDWAFDTAKLYVIQSEVANAADTLGNGSWLKVWPIKGGAGQHTISFKSEPTSATRTQALAINLASGKQQKLQAQQQLIEDVKLSTVKDVIDGADGKTYKVKGVCSVIANTNYGNWYMKDGDNEIYIYGTVDKTGSYNWSSFGIEVGDSVIVSGPRTTYGSTIELVDAQCVEVIKSLIQLDATSAIVSLEGGEAGTTATVKGDAISVDIPKEASWLTYAGTVVDGKKQKISFTAAPASEARTATVSLTCATSKAKSVVSFTVYQAATTDIAEAATTGTAYSLQGTVQAVYKDGFVVADKTGAAWIYQSQVIDPKTGKGSTFTPAVGDYVLLTGAKPSAYNGTLQFSKPTIYVVSAGKAKYDNEAPKATAEMLNAYEAAAGNKPITYVDSLVGVINSSYAVTVPGVKSPVTVSTPSSTKNLDALRDKPVKLNGYLIGARSSKIYFMAVAYEEAKDFEPAYLALSTYDAQEWTASSTKAVSITVNTNQKVWSYSVDNEADWTISQDGKKLSIAPADKNSSETADKKATVTVTAGDVTRTISVRQHKICLGYERVNTVTDGTYIVAAQYYGAYKAFGGDMTKNYGNPNAIAVSVKDKKIAEFCEKAELIITNVEGKGYTIQQGTDKRYFYQSGTKYNNFNLNASVDESKTKNGFYFDITVNADGTVSIVNKDSKFKVQFLNDSNNWGAYKDMQSHVALPYMFKLQNK